MRKFTLDGERPGNDDNYYDDDDDDDEAVGGRGGGERGLSGQRASRGVQNASHAE